LVECGVSVGMHDLAENDIGVLAAGVGYKATGLRTQSDLLALGLP